MTLPQSGNPISLLNLQLEYDDTPPTSMSEMYNKGQAPASGTLDMADFYQPASTAAVTTNLLFELDARNSFISSYSVKLRGVKIGLNFIYCSIFF